MPIQIDCTFLHDPNSSDLGKFYIIFTSDQHNKGVGVYGPKNNTAGTLVLFDTAKKARKRASDKSRTYLPCDSSELPQKALEHGISKIREILHIASHVPHRLTSHGLIFDTDAPNAPAARPAPNANKPKVTPRAFNKDDYWF